MSNLSKYLIIVGILIAVGAMLLIFGSQTITGDLVIEEGRINESAQLSITTELDPEINTQGVYAVQTIEGKEYDISAIVLDPSDLKIRDVSVSRNSFEDNFNGLSTFLNLDNPPIYLSTLNFIGFGKSITFFNI